LKSTLKSRTWPVFTIGLGSLLALLFLPGIAALRRSDEIYREIRQIQAAQQATQKSLGEIERQLYLVSIAVRESLLDTAPEQGWRYRKTLVEGRATVSRELGALRRTTSGVNAGLFDQLESELGTYWSTVEPLFQWTPAERVQRGTYFLREQQRPRRQSILAIAASISDLSESSYRKHYEQLNNGQREFKEGIERIVAIAFVLGILIASGSILRITVLENRSAQERAKAEAAEEQLRNLSTQLMHAQEKERTTLSRELHDEVGQMLTALRMQLTAIDRSRHDDTAFAEHLTESKALAEQTLRSVRDLAVGLRPSVLDLGLLPALQWQARQFSKLTQMQVRIQSDGDLDHVPEEQRTCIYRVVQESLTNAAKHANAKSVTIKIRQSSGRLNVTVQDDGAGFRKDSGSERGMGLVGMQERVRELGGMLRVDSHPARGTAIHVELESKGPRANEPHTSTDRG
jgi:signal transduction histidine kinase